MTYAKIRDGEVAQYPLTANDLIIANTHREYPKGFVTDADFRAYGARLVAETPPPTGDLVWEITPILVGDVWTQQWETRDFTAAELDAYKATRKGVAAQIRRYGVEQHQTIDTSTSGQSSLLWLLKGLEEGLDTTVNYRQKNGDFLVLNQTLLGVIFADAFDYIESVFNNEKLLTDQINAAINKAGVDAVDIDSGWPFTWPVEPPNEPPF